MLIAAGPSPGSGIEVVYYVIGCIIAIGSVGIGSGRGLMALKRRWTQEGTQRAESSRVIEENTKAAQANTAAIGDLGQKLGHFADSVHEQFDQVHAELNGHGTRITRVELQQGISPGGPNGGGH